MKIYEYNGKKNLCGPKIRQLRREKKLTQTDFAAQVQIKGVTLERDSISRIENGSRFVADYELKIFSEVLGKDVSFLLET